MSAGAQVRVKKKLRKIFFHQAMYFNNGPNTDCFALTHLSEFRNAKMGGPAPQKEVRA